MIHNFDYDLICNRLTWISYSQIQYEKSKKNAIKSIKKKKFVLVKLLYFIQLLFLPNKPRHADSSSFLIHIYFSTNAGFLRSLGFTTVCGSWNNANAASLLRVPPYWWKAGVWWHVFVGRVWLQSDELTLIQEIQMMFSL